MFPRKSLRILIFFFFWKTQIDTKEVDKLIKRYKNCLQELFNQLLVYHANAWGDIKEEYNMYIYHDLLQFSDKLLPTSIDLRAFHALEKRQRGKKISLLPWSKESFHMRITPLTGLRCIQIVLSLDWRAKKKKINVTVIFNKNLYLSFLETFKIYYLDKQTG